MVMYIRRVYRRVMLRHIFYNMGIKDGTQEDLNCERCKKSRKPTLQSFTPWHVAVHYLPSYLRCSDVQRSSKLKPYVSFQSALLCWKYYRCCYHCYDLFFLHESNDFCNLWIICMWIFSMFNERFVISVYHFYGTLLCFQSDFRKWQFRMSLVHRDHTDAVSVCHRLCWWC